MTDGYPGNSRKDEKFDRHNAGGECEGDGEVVWATTEPKTDRKQSNAINAAICRRQWGKKMNSGAG
jgi:hypothetical protein